MNYTPLPSNLGEHVSTYHSPYKKALATILIAMFLGIGATYAYFRNTSPKNNNIQTTPVVTVIPSPLPTVEQLPTPSIAESSESLISCTSDALCVQCPPGSDVTTDYPLGGCTQGSCVNGFCSWTGTQKTSPSDSLSPKPNTPSPIISCPSGTVKVCESGNCECISSNQ